MKRIKLPIVIILVLMSLNLFSQHYYYVSLSNEKATPNQQEKGMSNDEKLNLIFKEFEVKSYRQSFPGAKNAELRNYYEIHLPDSFIKSKSIDSFDSLLKNSKAFDAIYRSDYYELACDNPVPINDTWIANNLINNDALNLLNAQCAWTITTGDPNIIVGVIDTEFDTTHEDLINTFVGAVGSQTYFQNHGTSVSSCVATGTNNSKGIAGIGYNTRVKGYHADGGTLWNNIWQAYQDGIKIINVSWTGIGSYPNILAVQEMTDNGVVLVVAAGNTTTSTSHSAYANIPGVINVSGVWATNLHSGTNHAENQWVDVCALSKNVAVCIPGNTYGTDSGTSFASPQVAGVVALIRSINNNLTPAEIENIIKTTTDPIGDAHLFPGKIGTGRVNAYKAVLKAMCYDGETPGSISYSQTWDTEKYIVGNVIIENGITLTIQKPSNIADLFIRCAPNAKFIIKPGGKLIVDGGILTNICDGELWQGVFVEGNPNDILQSEGNQGVVELKNGAIIENAVCAINVGVTYNRGRGVYTYKGGGIVKANNASFINNLQAVKFAPYHRRKPVGAMFVTKNASYFSHCTFTINHQAFFDLNEFSEHVNLVGVEDVRFQSCNFLSVENKGTAIRSSLAGSFSLNHGYLLPLARSNITNFDVGICIQDGKPTNIHYTDFDNNNMAVVVEGSEAMYIGGNNFYIPYASYFGPTVGISLTNCSDFHIRDNLFQGEHNCNYGLIINQSGSYNNIVKNNEFSTLRMATVAYGRNSGIEYDIATLQFHLTGLQYHCNLFDNNNNDIVVSDFNTEQGSIRFVQGEENDACGNMFTENGVSLSSVNFPLYYFYHNHLHRHQPYQIVGNIETKETNHHSCGQIGRVDPMIVIVDKPVNWRHVLENEYQMLSNELAGVKNFYISHGYANGPIDWDTYFHTVPIPWALEHQVSLFHEICRLESQLSAIISTAFYCIQDEELFDSDLYLEWLEKTHTPEADYLRAEYYSEIGNYGECFNILHTIPTQHAVFDDMERQNYIDFFTIKMFLNDNLLVWSDLQDYPSEISILENLAESGVNRLAFKAKSILTTYFGHYQEAVIEPPHLIDLCLYVTYQGNPDNTNSNPNDSSKNDESYKNKLSIQEEDLVQHQDLQLIPNPACHELTLDNGQVAIKEVYIYNLLGKQIKHLNINDTKTTLNISDLSKGFYFLHIQTHQGVKVKRFVKE
ncbi:MAG: S8 family serine peptidase [Bacteroidales bacterium]|nr:S8 family serine peptidase [Bacteroidales bacterium]